MVVQACENERKNVSQKESAYINRLEGYLIQILDEADSGDTLKIVVLNPGYCKSCKIYASPLIDSLEDLIIVHDELQSCQNSFSTQKCIPYSADEFSTKGLSKLYSQFVVMHKRKILKLRALV